MGDIGGLNVVFPSGVVLSVDFLARLVPSRAFRIQNAILAALRSSLHARSALSTSSVSHESTPAGSSFLHMQTRCFCDLLFSARAARLPAAW